MNVFLLPLLKTPRRQTFVIVRFSINETPSFRVRWTFDGPKIQNTQC